MLFKKSNKYITNCNKFSLHVNKYALPCMYVLTYHISSLDSAQANDTVSSQETRSFSTLHSWHFYVSDCTIIYCWCGWWRPSSNRQLWSSVLKLRLSWPVCQVSRLDRHRHIIAQAIQACFNWMKLNVCAGRPGVKWCGYDPASVRVFQSHSPRTTPPI